MKITIIHNDVNHQRCVSSKTFENFLMVSYTDTLGNLPETIEEAEQLYAIAYREVIPVYQAIIKARLRQSELVMNDHFLMTLDASPYFNPDAIPMKISLHVRKQERVIGGVKEVGKSQEVGDAEQ